MKGEFTYGQTEAFGACGSMLMTPGYYPLDVIEFTPGRKTFQHYSYSGGLSIDIAPAWRIGGRMDFASRNAAKRKDLRYSAYRLDMSVMPAVQYHSEDFSAGAVFIYSRNSETVNAEQIGSAKANPSAFFDEGGMYGNYEVWTGSGTHLSEAGVSGLPFMENLGGVSLQLQKGRLYSDLSYVTGKLVVGEKQTIWYRSPSAKLEGRAAYRFAGAGADRSVRMHASWKSQDVDRSVLGKETTGGITLVKEYGSNRIQRRNVFDLDAAFESLGRNWDFCATAWWNMDDAVMSPMYPYIFGRRVMRYGVRGGVLRRFSGLSLWLAPGVEAGDVKESEALADASVTVSAKPYKLDKNDYYYICNEFASAFRATLLAGCRVELLSGLYAGLRAGLIKASGTEHMGGGMRWNAAIQLGYDF